MERKTYPLQALEEKRLRDWTEKSLTERVIQERLRLARSKRQERLVKTH